MRKYIIAVLTLAVATVASGQSLTGRVWETDGVDASVRGGTWSRQYNDQSSYASQDERHGTLVRFFDISTFADVTSPVDLSSIFQGDVPDLNNAIIVGGLIQVINPDANTNVSIGIESAVDLKAVGTWATAADILPIIPLWNVDGTEVGPVTSGNEIDLTWSGSLTNLMFMIQLDYFLGQ